MKIETDNLQIKMDKFFKEIQNRNGIWTMAQNEDVESRFSGEMQDELFETEDTSWWFKYRANVIYHIAKKYLQNKQIIFDVGGG